MVSKFCMRSACPFFASLDHPFFTSAKKPKNLKRPLLILCHPFFSSMHTGKKQKPDKCFVHCLTTVIEKRVLRFFCTPTELESSVKSSQIRACWDFLFFTQNNKVCPNNPPINCSRQKVRFHGREPNVTLCRSESVKDS